MLEPDSGIILVVRPESRQFCPADGTVSKLGVKLGGVGAQTAESACEGSADTHVRTWLYMAVRAPIKASLSHPLLSGPPKLPRHFLHLRLASEDLRLVLVLKLEQLAELVENNRDAARARVREFSIGGRHFDFNSQAAIMGVINLSPDSWYRESVCLTAEGAIRRGRTLMEQGAAIVDVGAESTLAQAALVDEPLQNSRLLPVIRALREAGGLVSVETYQPAVARACLEAGASVLNLTGTECDDELLRLVAAHDAALILCYVQGRNVREVGDFDFSADPVEQMRGYFERQIENARRNGVEKILIDPGLGFYYRNLQDSVSRVRHQMNMFLNTFRLRTLGFPVCHALPHAFEFFGEEVRCAEPFFAVLAALGRTDLFRTHEVPRTKAVLDTLRAF